MKPPPIQPPALMSLSSSGRGFFCALTAQQRGRHFIGRCTTHYTNRRGGVDEVVLSSRVFIAVP